MSGEEDTFRILIATDNHLGYKENDPIVGDDSFQAFEFILKTAREQHVDFLLLGGDLFDANKPSRYTLNRTIDLLAKYCLGSGDINFTFFPTENSPLVTLPLNYEDENINVALPIFAIHGNHDDPTREGSQGGALSALNILNSTRLINYFARIENVDDIHIRPLLFQKGSTRLAMYGMGYVPDERLSRMFEQQHVTFFQPPEEDTWFNLFIIHQNCESGRPTRTMRLDLLPAFLQLVVWGHEHECKIDPSWNEEGGFFTMQPGSSCITSLIEADTIPKKIALLEVRGKEFRVQPIPIPTIRPFIYRQLSLYSYPQLDATSPTVTSDIEAILDDEMISILDSFSSSTSSTILPLVRLAVDVTGFPSIPIQIYGAKYIGKIANPNSLLLLRRKRITAGTSGHRAKEEGGEEENSTGMALEMNETKGQFDIMRGYIQQSVQESRGLSFLNVNHLHEALSQFVNKGCSASWRSMIDHLDKLASQTINTLDIAGADPDSIIRVVKEEYAKDGLEYFSSLTRDMGDEDDEDNMQAIDIEDSDEEPPAKRKTTQKKRATSSNRRGRGK